MRLRQGEQGAAVVEFALVLPILMLFLFGIVEFGRGYNARIELTAAAREGARTAALGGTPAEIEGRTRAAAPDLSGSMSFPDTTVCTGSPAPPNGSVRVVYEFTYDIPFLGRKTTDLTATGVMRCGG